MVSAAGACGWLGGLASEAPHAEQKWLVAGFGV
jgi:hypothetical protein